jgi:zinc transporter
MDMTGEKGLLHCYLLDGKGCGTSLDWTAASAWKPEDGVLWMHLEYSDASVQKWMLEESGLSTVSAEAMLSEETRPRSVLTANGLLLTLRGINPHPDASPEDMVALRLWSDGRRILTTRRRRLQSAREIAEALNQGVGPRDAGEFIESITDRIVARMAEVIDAINEDVDSLEEEVLTREAYELRPKLSELRRTTIGLRRYLAPQREAVMRLYAERIEWLSDTDRSRLRESADRTTRFVEEIDLVRERAIVVQEDLSSRLTEKMDKTMYVLSIVASIFLPLGFLTGLLGINIGGIPGADYAGAFLVFCALLVGIVGFQIWLFKAKKWM